MCEQWGRLRNTRKRVATRTRKSAVANIRNIATRIETLLIGMGPAIKTNESGPGRGTEADGTVAAKVRGAPLSHE